MFNNFFTRFFYNWKFNGAVTGTGSISGFATSNRIIGGNAGTLKFTTGALILHVLQIKQAPQLRSTKTWLITGP